MREVGCGAAGAMQGMCWDQYEPSMEDELEQRLCKSMRSAAVTTRAPGTWSNSYTSLLARFRRFCGERLPPRKVCPAEPMTVCLFLQLVADSARTYSVVKSASGMIFTLHALALVPEDKIPTKCAMAKLIRAAAKRKLGLKLVNQKDPLPLEVLRAGVVYMIGDETRVSILALSQAAMVMVMWCGFLRYKDMRNIYVQCIKFYKTHMEIFLHYRKNDQFRKGDIVYIARGSFSDTCPVRLAQLLISRGGLRGEEPLFQGWDGVRARWRGQGGLPLSGQPVSYDQCRQAFFKLVAKATARPESELKAQFGTQSCRSGGATVAAKTVDFRRFQQHGAWQSATSAHRYIQDSVADRVEVTQTLGY